MQFALIKSIIGLLVVICYFFLFTFILLFISYHYHHHHHYSKSEGKRNVKKLWTFSNSTTCKKWRQASSSLFLLSSYSSPMFQFGPHGKDFAICLLAYLSLSSLVSSSSFSCVSEGSQRWRDSLNGSLSRSWSFDNTRTYLSIYLLISILILFSHLLLLFILEHKTHFKHIFLLLFTTNSSHNKEIN